MNLLSFSDFNYFTLSSICVDYLDEFSEEEKARLKSLSLDDDLMLAEVDIGLAGSKRGRQFMEVHQGERAARTGEEVLFMLYVAAILFRWAQYLERELEEGQSYAEALHYYRLSAEQGHRGALEWMAKEKPLWRKPRNRPPFNASDMTFSRIRYSRSSYVSGGGPGTGKRS